MADPERFDPDPDPNFDADEDPNFYLGREKKCFFKNQNQTFVSKILQNLSCVISRQQ